MSFNQYEPYGPVVETTMRIITWGHSVASFGPGRISFASRTLGVVLG